VKLGWERPSQPRIKIGDLKRRGPEAQLDTDRQAEAALCL
jgi:hypothetical protein